MRKTTTDMLLQKLTFELVEAYKDDRENVAEMLFQHGRFEVERDAMWAKFDDLLVEAIDVATRYRYSTPDVETASEVLRSFRQKVEDKRSKDQYETWETREKAKKWSEYEMSLNAEAEGRDDAEDDLPF